MVKKTDLFSNIYLFFVLLFLYLPIVVLIVFSFNKSKYGGIWTGFTLDWYKQLFKDKSIISSLYNTFFVAAASSIVSTIIGTLASLGIQSMRSNYKKAMMNLSYISMINPDIVIGVSLISFFSLFKFLKLGYVTLILAHITFCLPYVVFAVLPKLQQLNPNLSEAAQDLGATPIQTFFKVVLPEIKPGILSGALMAFTLSLDDFIVSFFTTGSGIATLSIKVYSMTKRGVSPKINALTTLMLVVIIALMIVLQIRTNKMEQEKNKL
ncbi:ABC transporter permease [Peptoanaerobacter stomatis]|uniref:ABC transmembrane type-1 domain-containing protein n=1 Tax=Peptoanaerobacter stomatis TaxID=796937 RepID=G9X1N7_9FIRM|nr:ABC transporter permease [Peptoanaerobacter stomatis]EHL13010.1 hypothetical protein HMPREF9629_00310 [Peptoanaerobacter stomatis]EHL19513.1 hypothetical protein HMPREF9628_00234 [Peptoanaerobacter stomatis]